MAAFFAQASQSNANSVAVTSSAGGMLHHPPGLPLISAQVNPVQTVQPPMNALQVGFPRLLILFSLTYSIFFFVESFNNTRGRFGRIFGRTSRNASLTHTSTGSQRLGIQHEITEQK